MSGDAGAEVTQVAHLTSALRIRFAMNLLEVWRFRHFWKVCRWACVMLAELHRTQQLHPDQSQVPDNRLWLWRAHMCHARVLVFIPGCGGGIAWTAISLQLSRQATRFGVTSSRHFSWKWHFTQRPFLCRIWILHGLKLAKTCFRLQAFPWRFEWLLSAPSVVAMG